MRILFVENRYKTALWELVGKDLVKKGHEIYWIVQNPIFKPSFGKITLLPFPKGSITSGNETLTPELEKVINSNRALNYFEVKSGDFIFHYNELIQKAMDKINPDLVFGESTAFHELLVINSCKQRGIPFLHPSSCRYPSRRFSFYMADTLTPFGGSEETFELERAREIVQAIATRTVLPDYMKKPVKKTSKTTLLADKLRLIRGYYKGEKYNTPSPFVKRKLNTQRDKHVEIWEQLATKVESTPGKFKLLFPLQMQPEANIDVWGYPNRNQTDIVSEIAKNLEKDEVLIVKPNPKSKYEIDPVLLEIIRSNKQVVAMHHKSKMDEVLEITDLVVTVTGTIALECVFANKPVTMLGIGIQSGQDNCIKINNLSELRKVIQLTRSGEFPTLSFDERVNFLQKLVKTSFSGVIADALLSRHELEDPENQKALLSAFNQVIRQVEGLR